MKKITNIFSISAKQYFWSVIVVLLIATFLRFYNLGNVPHGMTWDEAAIGYNGYAIFTTRRDEWLKRLPISFWSFGDYKAPLAIYLNGFFTFLLGMNLFAVRFPFAVFGVMAVLGFILWLKLFLEELSLEESQSRLWSLVGGVLLTLSPWHLHYSRAGFESGMALSLMIWGLYFWQKFWQKSSKKNTLWLLLFTFSMVAAIYTYHSSKIVIPLLGLLLVWQKRSLLKENIKQFSISAVLGLIGLAPFVYDSVFGKGLERAGTLIFSQNLGFLELAKTVIYQTWAHLKPNFLFFGETTTLRHGDGRGGVLLITTGLACLVAILALFKYRQKLNKLTTFSLWLIFLGLLPAILGTEVPHSNRALLALPGFILLAVSGLKTLPEIIKKRSIKYLLILFFFGHLILFAGYLNNYYKNFATESAEAFQDGYLEAFEFVIPYEKGLDDKPKVDKIIFSSNYGQPYIYALFTRKTNPIWYQGGSLIKYEFKDEITIGDLERKNTIVVASNEDDLLGENDKADHIIYGSDGSIRFRIYLNLGE